MFNKYNRIVKSHTDIKLYEKNFKCDNKLNIVLDLDNTIICTEIYDSTDILKIKYIELFKNKQLLGKFTIGKKIYIIFIRPYFTYFLNTITMYFYIYIYTNSSKIYCDNVLNLLKLKYFNFEVKKIICRNDTLSYIKQLSIISDNADDLHFLTDIPEYNEFRKKTIIIDDTIDVWKFDKDNLIVIDPYKSIFEKDKLPDDILLILTNRLFLIYNLFYLNIEENSDFDIKNLIFKYKL